MKPRLMALVTVIVAAGIWEPVRMVLAAVAILLAASGAAVYISLALLTNSFAPWRDDDTN